MKENTYVSSTGVERTNYMIDNEADSFVFQSVANHPDKFGDKFYVTTPEGLVIKLTGGQANFFNRNPDIKPGTKIVTSPYTNGYGSFLGLQFADKNDMVKTKTNTATTATAKLPSLGQQPAPVAKADPVTPGLTANDEMIINQLVSCADYAPWKEYAKVSVQQFKEAFLGVAEKMNLKADLVGDKSAIAYNIFFSKV